MPFKFELSFAERADQLTVFGVQLWRSLSKLLEINTICTLVHSFFYKQHFYMQHQAKIGKKISKNQATLCG